MATFLKSIGNAASPLPINWMLERPEALDGTAFPKTPRSVRPGDFLIFYAAGRRCVVAIMEVVDNPKRMGHPSAFGGPMEARIGGNRGTGARSGPPRRPIPDFFNSCSWSCGPPPRDEKDGTVPTPRRLFSDQAGAFLRHARKTYWPQTLRTPHAGGDGAGEPSSGRRRRGKRGGRWTTTGCGAAAGEFVTES